MEKSTGNSRPINITSQTNKISETPSKLSEIKQGTKMDVRLRNELPRDVQIYWEAKENGKLTHKRRDQGILYGRGGEMLVHTFQGDIFSYVFENVRYYVTAPKRSEDAYIVLNADEEDILVRCTSSVRCMANRGQIFEIIVKPSWAPQGAARFLELVRKKYFDMAMVRDDQNGFARFGVGRDPVKLSHWHWLSEYISDDPRLSQITFEAGMVSFAGYGKPNTLPTDVFIVMPYAPHDMLRLLGRENPWEAPFGFVKNVNHTAVSEWFVYDDNDWPDFGTIDGNGNQFAKDKNSRTDFIERCIVVKDVV